MIIEVQVSNLSTLKIENYISLITGESVMKSITIIILLWLLAMANLSAQGFYDNEEAVAEETTTVNKWRILIGYSVVDDPKFGSDALDLEAGWYLLDNMDISFPELFPQASLSLGPSVAVRVNSGLLNNQRYAEQIMLWTVGITSRMDFPESFLRVDLNAGELTGYFTQKSGYEERKKSTILSGLIDYRLFSGRINEEWLFTTWNVTLAWGLPWSDQKFFDWGYNQLEHRQTTGGQDVSSIHATAELGLLDLAMSDEFIFGLTVRGLGGKYNSNVKYFGLGGGLDFVLSNIPIISVNADYIWGWDNSTFKNWNFSVRVRYDRFANFYENQ